MKHFIKTTFYVVVAIFAFYGCSSDKGERLSVNYQKYTLENGLDVVLHEDHSDPIVGVAIQFHVGSGREKMGKTGFAHFFEHTLFQRSENLPRNAFFQKISSMGGNFNGGTWQDGTIYYETVPRDALEKVLWMESDRMGFFINTVTQAGLDREVDIILNEIRQTADNTAYGQLEAIFAKEMYPAGHPYSWTVGGEMDDIRSATIEDVKDFYNTYYIPQNATIAIAGDFDMEQTKAMVEKYFGEIKKGNDIERPKVRPAELDEVKKVYYEDPFAPLPYLKISYPSVNMLNSDEAPLSMLAELLGGSKDSPLYKTVVEANLAPNVWISDGAQEVSGTFDINIQTYDGVSLNDLQDAINKAFEMFEEDGVNSDQMKMAKAMKEKNSYSMLSSVNGKAMSFAMSNEFNGKPDGFIDDLEAFKAVSSRDVMRVYNKYIKGKNCLAISIVPEGKKELALSDSRKADVYVENVEDESSKKTKSAAGAIVDDDYPRTPSKLNRSVEPPYLANTPALTLPVLWSGELSNGMKLSGITHREIPLVTFDIVLKGGLLLDRDEKPGVSYLNAALMNEGTKLRTAEEIEKALNLLGASVRVYSDGNKMGISGDCLSKNFSEVMKIVEEIITSPLFDEEALEREKNKVIAKIQQDAKDPNSIASAALNKLLFGEESVISKRPYGTMESVKSINIYDVQAFYTNKFSPRIASFNITGNITKIECEAALQSLAGNWHGIEVKVPQPNQIAADNGGKIFFVDYPGAKQSVIMVGGAGLPYSDPNYYSLDVLNYKLGSGSNGELFNVLRLQRGYTYGAYSDFSSSNGYGVFRAASSVQANVTDVSVNLFKEILSHFGKSYTQEMLSDTKDAMIRAKAFSFETQRGLLRMLDNIYVYNLPSDYVKREEVVIKSINLEQIMGLALKYLDTDDLTFVVVGDAKTQFNKIKGAIKVHN